MNAKMYPTSNQERQMHCVRHTQHAMPCKAPALRLHVLQEQVEVVTVQVPDQADRDRATRILASCGWPFSVIGNTIIYAEVNHV